MGRDGTRSCRAVHPPTAVLSLIEKFLKANILDGTDQWTPTAVAPQGAVLSPLLSNVYLDPLDHLMARSGWHIPDAL